MNTRSTNASFTLIHDNQVHRNQLLPCFDITLVLNPTQPQIPIFHLTLPTRYPDAATSRAASSHHPGEPCHRPVPNLRFLPLPQTGLRICREMYEQREWCVALISNGNGVSLSIASNRSFVRTGRLPRVQQFFITQPMSCFTLNTPFSLSLKMHPVS
jgi:hypothetical protein